MADVMTAVAADGWQATVDSPTELSLTPVTVTRAGFDVAGSATTHSDTLKQTKRVRQPWPNDASLVANVVALSDYVYSGDTISGVTNSSTEASPKPICNWIMPHRLLVGDTVDLEIVAFHRDARDGAQVACVEFSATDGTTTVTQTVASAAVSNRTGDRYSVIAYRALLDISSLSDNALITCNAKVYPWFGDSGSVADSADSSVAREFSPRYFLRDTALLASPPRAYVSTAGDDNDGQVSTDDAIARAHPYATFAKAYSGVADLARVDGAEIRIMDDGGTPFAIVPAFDVYAQNVACVTVTRDPTVARANARVSQGALLARFRLGSTGTLTAPLATGALRFHDIDIVRTGASTMAGESATQLEIVFEDVNFDMNGQSNTWLSNSHDYMFGVTFSNIGGANPLSAATYEHRCMRGVSASYSGGLNIEDWLLVGCEFDKVATLLAGTRPETGTIVAFNTVREPTASALFTFGATADVSQVAIVQNVFEWTTATTGPTLGISHDDKTGSNTHMVIHNNTFAGAFNAGRVNIFYDEGSTERTSRLMSVKGNIFVSINTKSDVYRGANQGNPEGFSSGSPSTRTGNWAFENGVGCAGNLAMYIDASEGGIGSSFAQDYPGLSCDIGTSSTVKIDPLFTDDQAVTFDGTDYHARSGGGDYTLQAGSPAIGLLPVAVLPYTLDGTARDAANDNAGAMALAAAEAAVLSPSLLSNGQSFPAPSVAGTATVAAALLNNAQSFASPAVSASISLAPGLVANGQSFGAAVVSAMAGLAATLVDNAATVLAPAVTGQTALQPGLLANSQSFPGAVVSARSTLAASLLASTGATFAPVVTAGGGIAPALVVNAQGFPGATVAAGTVSLATSLLANGQAFPGASVTGEGGLSPTLVTNAQSFGTAAVAPGGVTLGAPVLGNAQGFFAPMVAGGGALAVPLLTNPQSFGAASVSPGAVTLAPSVLANDNAIFTPVVAGAAARALLPSLVSNATALFTPGLQQQRRRTVLRPIEPARQRPRAISRGW